MFKRVCENIYWYCFSYSKIIEKLLQISILELIFFVLHTRVIHFNTCSNLLGLIEFVMQLRSMAINTEICVITGM